MSIFYDENGYFTEDGSLISRQFEKYQTKLEAIERNQKEIDKKLDTILEILVLNDPPQPQQNGTQDNPPQPKPDKKKCSPHLWAMPKNDAIKCESCGHRFKVSDMASMTFQSIINATRKHRDEAFAKEFEEAMRESAARVGLKRNAKIPKMI